MNDLAAGIDEPDAGAAVRRLLERVSTRADALELRAALVELGARAVVEAAVARR
jgi:hypothetical protein